MSDEAELRFVESHWHGGGLWSKSVCGVDEDSDGASERGLFPPALAPEMQCLRAYHAHSLIGLIHMSNMRRP